MPNVSSETGTVRPMVAGLFVASCLLSIVSWYTTQQGMALYLNTWFSVLASIGIQAALVLVAWLIGFSRTRRALLIAVYAITAVVSVAFSYVALYTWFSAKERPLAIERRLYDTLQTTAAKAQETLTAAVNEQRKHATALDEMTAAEKSHGYIARAQDADPYLAKIREAVAREASTYSASYREGSGEGLRYTAFDRYAKLARQSLERLEQAQASIAAVRGQIKPLDPTEKQLRDFQQVYDTLPWSDAEGALHAARIDRAALPNYADFVDRSASGQEDMMIAFNELVSAPSGRHVFAFLLAAFIDVVVFLLAYSSGPYFLGSPEQRWLKAGAVLDSLDHQVFARGFLRKVFPAKRGIARVDASTLTPGEQQLCLLLAAKGLAVTQEEDGRLIYLLDHSVHEQLLDVLAAEGLPLRASPAEARS
jgi:hypothetical protein